MNSYVVWLDPLVLTMVPMSVPSSAFSIIDKFWVPTKKVPKFWAWNAPEAPEIAGSPLCSPRRTDPVSRSTDAAKIGESAAKLTPVSIRKRVSEFDMLSPSPPMMKIRFPKNSDEPPSPFATPLKKPSRLNAESSPKLDELPNWVNESSRSWGFA